MIGRTLKILVSPGVPFLPEAVQQTLAGLRNRLSLQVYDCQTPTEAFDALSHFWPDSVILASGNSLDKEQLDSLLRRTLELGGEDQPKVYILNKVGKVERQQLSFMDVLEGTQNDNYLHDKLLEDAKPKKILDAEGTKSLKAVGFQYEWMGRTTLTEEGASRVLYAEERFRNLVNNSLDLVCVVEEDGFIKYASQSSFAILGIKPDKLAGSYIQDYLHKCKRNNIAKWFARHKGRTGFSEIKAAHSLGHDVYLEAACVDMTGDQAIRGYVITARDTTFRRSAEEKLTYQGRLLANIRESVVGLDASNCVTYMNRAAERFYKVAGGEVIGKPWNEICSVEWMHPEEELFAEEAIAENGQWQGEVIHALPNGRKFQVEISVTAHQERLGASQSLLLVIRDIRDRKVVERVLHESESRYRSLVNVTSDLVWHTNEEGVLTFISPKVVDLLGYATADVLGHSLTEFLAKNQYTNPTGKTLAEALQKKEPFSYIQGTFLTKDGKVKFLEVSGHPHLVGQKKLKGYHGAIRDVTEQVEAERSIRKSLTEKDTLIKEIHHRVKNNMQIVSSLLYLQTQFIKDPDMLARLQESQDRIHSMALVHEKLYQSRDLALIDLNDYLESLSRHITNSYRNSFVHLQLLLPDDLVFIGIDTAIPCGLVVNELLTNAYKYAFAPNERGVVTVKLKAIGSAATLEIYDTGKGLPKTDISAYESSSLGMQLVDALVHQLRGKLTVENREGAYFRLEFSL